MPRLFAGLGAQLPLPTRIVVMASNFVVAYLPFLVVGGIAAVFFLKRYYRTDGGELLIDRFMLKVPVAGLLIRKIAVARFCRTLGTLIASGVPILEALGITADTAGNRVVKDAVMATRRSIEGGPNDRWTAQGVGRLSSNGRADDRRRRRDRCARHDAQQDCPVLRGHVWTPRSKASWHCSSRS